MSLLFPPPKVNNRLISKHIGFEIFMKETRFIDLCWNQFFNNLAFNLNRLKQMYKSKS